MGHPYAKRVLAFQTANLIDWTTAIKMLHFNRLLYIVTKQLKLWVDKKFWKTMSSKNTVYGHGHHSTHNLECMKCKP